MDLENASVLVLKPVVMHLRMLEVIGGPSFVN